MIKLCIFDLDGTIANTLEDLADAMNFSLTQNGFAVNPIESYRQFVGDGVIKLIERASGCTDSKIIASIKDGFDNYYRLHSTDKTKPYNGISELMDKLSNCNVQYAVFSNKPNEFIDGILNTIYPGKSFLFAVGKQQGYEPKPCPDAMLSQLQKHSINVSECLYVGDSNVDIYTAKNAKMVSCGVAWGFRGPDELKACGADNIAYSANDIFNIVCASEQ